MTTVFHTTEIVPHHKKKFDVPDIETDLKKIYESTEYELSCLEFSSDPDDETDFDKQKGKVESKLEELKFYAKSSEIADYQSYVEALERQIEALTWSLLNVARRADNMAKDILSLDNKMDRARSRMSSTISLEMPLVSLEAILYCVDVSWSGDGMNGNEITLTA
ncbi:cytosine-specific DNA methyltransferase [Salmonella phage 40]|nr:cytosine-specific DNA methyltransferase [Salmonella phage 40]